MVVLFDEGIIQLLERDVLNAIMFTDKILKIAIRCLMTSQSAWRTVDSHTFGKVFHILTIQLQQLPLVLPDDVHGVLDKFCCDIPLFVKNFFIITAYVLFKPAYLVIVFFRGAA